MNMDQLLQLNDKLMGLPAGVLVFGACIALGYAIKMTERIHNTAIPLVVMLAGVVLFALMAPTKLETEVLRIWLVKNVCVGWIIGFGAWMAHKLVLKKIEDKLGMFSDPPKEGTPPVGSLKDTITKP
jgi:hypothetical protein